MTSAFSMLKMLGTTPTMVTTAFGTRVLLLVKVTAPLEAATRLPLASSSAFVGPVPRASVMAKVGFGMGTAKPPRVKAGVLMYVPIALLTT